MYFAESSKKKHFRQTILGTIDSLILFRLHSMFVEDHSAPRTTCVTQSSFDGLIIMFDFVFLLHSRTLALSDVCASSAVG